MFVRVVRFTDVDPERIAAVAANVEEFDGPPPGVPAVSMRMLMDEEQRTVVVLQEFASAEDMAVGAAVLEAMDSSETPGTRVSVDACEVRIETVAS